MVTNSIYDKIEQIVRVYAERYKESVRKGVFIKAYHEKDKSETISDKDLSGFS